MQARFTDDFRAVMQSAGLIANLLEHDTVRNEHVLLALLRGRHAVGWHVLKSLGVDMIDMEKETHRILSSNIGQDALAAQTRATQPIECAQEQSDKMGHDHIGTEHMVLGFLAQGKGVAAQLLKKRNLTLSATKEQVIRLLG